MLTHPLASGSNDHIVGPPHALLPSWPFILAAALLICWSFRRQLAVPLRVAWFFLTLPFRRDWWT